MTNFAGTDPNSVDRTAEYLAHNIRVRQTVDLLNSELKPGERPWSPAEVQETVWSFQRSLSRRLGRSALQAKRDRRAQRGRSKRWGMHMAPRPELTQDEALRTLTDGEINSTPDYLDIISSDAELAGIVRRISHELA